MGTFSGVTVNAELGEGFCEGVAVMLSQHVDLHRREESVDQREAGLVVIDVRDTGLKFEELVDVRVQVAGLAVGDVRVAIVEGVIAIVWWRVRTSMSSS